MTTLIAILRMARFGAARLLAPAAFLVLLAGPAAAGAGTVTVVESVELGASADQVWALVGKFGRLNEWHPAVVETHMKGDPNKIGSVRTLVLKGGAEIDEQLIGYSNAHMRYIYRILRSPLPVADYEAYIAVLSLAGNRSLVIWGANFNAKGASDAVAANTIRGIFQAGLGALTDRFGD